jgi:hypothetical protein
VPSYADEPITYGKMLQYDINSCLLGRKLGEGSYREVYEHATDPTKVVKIESALGDDFCNVVEWELWRDLEDRDDQELLRWFAPCYHISGFGRVLIQARTKKLKALPREIPSVFTDLKLSNWGLYKGRPVCHDYGFHRAQRLGLKKWHMRAIRLPSHTWGHASFKSSKRHSEKNTAEVLADF